MKKTMTDLNLKLKKDPYNNEVELICSLIDKALELSDKFHLENKNEEFNSTVKSIIELSNFLDNTIINK